MVLSLGFIQSPTEPCLYLWRENKNAASGSALTSGEKFVIILVYVDDDLVLSSHDELDDWFFSSIKKEYGEDVKRKTNSFTFLGMKVEYKENDCHLTMPAYCEKIVAETSLINPRVASTPESISKTVFIDTCPADKDEFQRILGIVNYLALMCRHDLLGPISRLATCVSAPTAHDMTRLHRVVRYIKGTPHRGFVFRPSKGVNLECFVDASFDSHHDSKSHTGYCFFIGNRSGAFFARSSKQPIVTLSSAESEYYALYEALTEVIWFRNLLEDIGFLQINPTVVHEDNTATISISKGGGSHHKIKHFDRKLHFIEDVVARGIALILHCGTREQVADLLTKALDLQTFEFHLSPLMFGHRQPASTSL